MYLLIALTISFLWADLLLAVSGTCDKRLALWVALEESAFLAAATARILMR